MKRLREIMRLSFLFHVHKTAMVFEAVRVGEHLYVDGGVIDVFPAQPLVERERPDLVIGVNTILPPRFEGEDISGWSERRLGFMSASRQLSHAGHLELARRTKQRLGRRLLLIDRSTTASSMDGGSTICS